MKILFATFGELSVESGSVRSVAMLRALADAGHRVDVIAARAKLPSHPHVQVLAGAGEGRLPQRKLRMAIMGALGRRTHDVVHALDTCAPFASRICRLRKVPFVYDAARCFTGPAAEPPSIGWRWFARRGQRIEKRMIGQAAAIFAGCDALVQDLRGLAPEADVSLVEDVPAQFLATPEDGALRALQGGVVDGPVGLLVVAGVVQPTSAVLRDVLLASRKVVDSNPQALFVFKGLPVRDAAACAANLDIAGRCVFLEESETARYLGLLKAAGVLLFVPPASGRYLDAEAYTLLHASAPLVAVQADAYAKLLTDRNCIPVLQGADAIAEGVRQAVQEPLFSLGISLNGEQLIADRHSYSSFKHKVRMAYHALGIIE